MKREFLFAIEMATCHRPLIAILNRVVFLQRICGSIGYSGWRNLCLTSSRTDVGDRKCLTLFVSSHCNTSRMLMPLVSPQHEIIRYKTTVRKSKKESKRTTDDSGSDVDEDEDEASDDEEFSEDEVAGPPGFKYMKVHTLRCDTIISRGLNFSSSETQKLFYSSKILNNDEVLMKKSKKVQEGETLDVIVEESETTRKVKRVEIVKISSKLTQKGNPIVHIRIWRSPFEAET